MGMRRWASARRAERAASREAAAESRYSLTARWLEAPVTWSPGRRAPMSCVILAAGRGSRLAGGIGVKPLVPVLGLPLLERTIVTASEAGLSEFFVVTGCQAARVESFLSGLRLRRNLEIRAIRNEAWEAGNASSLLAARRVIDEDFVLLVADHVFDPAILRRLLGQHLEEGEIVLAVDFRVDDNALVDVEDATKVAVRGQWVAAVGKELREYDAFDTGIFLCSPAILPAFEVSICEGDDSLAGGVRRLARQRRARVLDIGGHSWVDIDTPGDLRKARVLLSRSLAKPDDGLIARTINRKLSGRLLTPLLLRLAPGVSPNQVSALAFAVAIAAAAAFLLGQPVIGGLTVQLASVLDGCDGEIARLKKAESRFGSFFDAVLDRYADTFLLVGAGYYAWSAGDQSVLFGPHWSALVVLVSILAASGNLLVSYTSAKSVADLGYRYRGRFIAAGRGRDLRLFVLFLGAVLTSVDPSTVLLALLLVALATNAVVVARTWTSWRLAQPAPPFVSAAALIFDFDGTIADTMPFLTKLAVDLLTQHYPVEPAAARKRYLDTVGVGFASQLEELFPGPSGERGGRRRLRGRQAGGDPRLPGLFGRRRGPGVARSPRGEALRMQQHDSRARRELPPQPRARGVVRRLPRLRARARKGQAGQAHSGEARDRTAGCCLRGRRPEGP
jgi:1L-myo-inositol 1-phosphate cytidylyltransferase / CDP-L-myo-inositol myo-inositolphosphotransferase